jgi:CRISPR/Cas system CSM-associated protein Csm3 (group 7 of RAMP superfamily)
MQKIYYQCAFRQLAPLRIGTGSGEKTDNDIRKDSRGFPMIPGTSLAGVLRALLPPEDADAVFGYLKTGDHAEIVSSAVLVGDAVLPAGTRQSDYRISERDGVGLTDHGAKIDHAKYDFEVVECDLPYTAILELADDADEETVVPRLERALRLAQAEGLHFGARSTRGYGLVSVSIAKRSFEFPRQLDEWLDFDPLTGAYPDRLPDGPLPERRRPIRVELTVKMRGSFSVRVYTTAIARENEAAPDQIALENRKGDAVLPGTSWAGSFRHHMRLLAQGSGLDEAVLNQIDALFGVTGKVKKRSEIRFREAEINTKKRLTITRNAIDRFTNVPCNRALFTSRVAHGGEGEATIELPTETDPKLLRLLAAAINDLDLGLMTLGGEAGVGRGLCEVTALKVNGTDQTQSMKALKTDYLLGGGV